MCLIFSPTARTRCSTKKLKPKRTSFTIDINQRYVTFFKTCTGSRPALCRSITWPSLVSWYRCFGNGGTLRIASIIFNRTKFFLTLDFSVLVTFNFLAFSTPRSYLGRIVVFLAHKSGTGNNKKTDLPLRLITLKSHWQYETELIYLKVIFRKIDFIPLLMTIVIVKRVCNK